MYLVLQAFIYRERLPLFNHSFGCIGLTLIIHPTYFDATSGLATFKMEGKVGIFRNASSKRTAGYFLVVIFDSDPFYKLGRNHFSGNFVFISPCFHWVGDERSDSSDAVFGLESNFYTGHEYFQSC